MHGHEDTKDKRGEGWQFGGLVTSPASGKSGTQCVHSAGLDNGNEVTRAKSTEKAQPGR